MVREIVVNRNDSVFRYTYYFDGNRNKVMENKFYVKDNVNYPAKRTEWVYKNNNIVTQRHQKWENGNWITNFLINNDNEVYNTQRETYIQVIDNVEVIEKTTTTAYINGMLISVYKYNGPEIREEVQQEIRYDYNDKKQITRQSIILGNNILTSNKQVYNYNYTPDGLLDSIMLTFTTPNSTTKELLTTHFYDKSSKNMTTQIQKKWHADASIWDNHAKSAYTYDQNNKLTSEIYYHYNVMFWAPNTKYEYVYNTDGFLVEKIMYQPIYRQWRRIYTIHYADIENGQPNLMESKYNFWGGETGSFVNNYIPYYFNEEIAIMNADRLELKYFIDPTELNNIPHKTGWLKIHPNPSDGLFYISTEDYHVESWEVYSINGVLIKKEQSSYRTGIVDLTPLPDGVYIIIVKTTDNEQLKQKLIINRKK